MTFNFTNAPTDYLETRFETCSEMMASLAKSGNVEAFKIVLAEQNAIEAELHENRDWGIATTSF